MISFNDIHSSISDGKTLDLLRTISLEPCNSEILFNKTKFTPKQYYSRIIRLTNAGLFVSDRSKENLKSSSSSNDEDDKEQSKEPDYDEDEDQLEEEQEEESGEITTTNLVF
jgi:hypothetical protein